MSISIRLAEKKDYLRILEILNQSIHLRKVTALLTPVTLKSREKWFQDHQDGRYPIYVAEDDGFVVGWMAVSAYRDGREGFLHSCEVSYYLDLNRRGEGIASMLMEHVLKGSRNSGIKNMMAVIFEKNEASLALVKKFGFKPWGRLPNVIEIDGNIQDCIIMGRSLRDIDY